MKFVWQISYPLRMVRVRTKIPKMTVFEAKTGLQKPSCSSYFPITRAIQKFKKLLSKATASIFMQNDHPTGVLDLWSSAAQLKVKLLILLDSYNCCSCRTVITVVPIEQLAASKLGGEMDWSLELWWESRGRSPRPWTSSPKNQQCHLIVSLSPFSLSFLPFNAKNLKASCISHVDRMSTLLPTNNTNKLRKECISNKK